MLYRHKVNKQEIRQLLMLWVGLQIVPVVAVTIVIICGVITMKIIAGYIIYCCITALPLVGLMWAGFRASYFEIELDNTGVKLYRRGVVQRELKWDEIKSVKIYPLRILSKHGKDICVGMNKNKQEEIFEIIKTHLTQVRF